MDRIGSTKEFSDEKRVEILERSSKTVGRAVFFSILITLISLMPILLLTGQEQKLFSPLVLTKTFTMIGSAIVAILIIPMLLRTFMKGRLVPESRNKVSAFFTWIYSHVIRWCLKWKKTVIAIALLIVLGSIPVVLRLGTEFMPPLDEGSILFMPVTMPDISNSEAKRIMQVQDRIIKSVPEVESVLGKAGRAYTATDNAPMSMIETIIILKPRSQWRSGMTKEKLVQELNEKVQIPGVIVGWTQPIINRINMLSTGIRLDVGIKVYGQDLDSIYSLSLEIEKALQGVEGLEDLYVEQLTGGKYLDIKINRKEAGRYGLSIDDVNMVIETALGGMPLTTTVEGRQRFNVNLRLAQNFRSDLAEIRRIPIQTSGYGVIPLSAVAKIDVQEGPPMISSENAMLRGTVLFNIRGRDMGSVVKEARQRISERFEKLPEGYFIEWSGQYENQVRAQKRLSIIIPLTLVIIAFILYFTFNSVRDALIILTALPVALIGGVYSLFLFNVNFSVAVAVGFIALFGVAIETGVLIILYMNEELSRMVVRKGNGRNFITNEDISNSIFSGAALRVRPILMTVMADTIGLLPVLLATGTGSDVMRPITIPFVFGLISATLFVLIVLPVVYQLVHEWHLEKYGTIKVLEVKE